ncbi:MAG TPA: B12-binding domain-containing radical SAM protein [Candidatus Brocadiaceae bacterium]
MKILLIRPFTDATQGNSPPFALMYLSSYLKSKQIDTILIDKCVHKRFFGDFRISCSHVQNLLQDINDYNPDIIGMTLFSRELKEISTLCRLIKNEFKSKIIVLGGPHPTAMSDECLKQIPECDFIVRGEGEITFSNLIESLHDNKDLSDVKGISFRSKNEILHNKDADINYNLDDFPFPDRESLIRNYKNGSYGHIVYGSPSDILMTSRGCPFQCGFCFKVCSKYRNRSPENVINEIDWIVKNIMPEYIQIMDDSFTIQKERCTRILDKLTAKKYPCKFKVRSRANAVDKELLDKMKQAGVTTVVYGFESGSQKMLDAFNKKTTVKQNIAACTLTKKAGLNCFGDMILFYPGETKETLKETEKFIKSAKPHAVKFYVLTPLPKTKVYEEAKKNGNLVGDWQIDEQSPWIKLDEFDGITEMEQIAKKMFRRQFLIPWRVFWFLQYHGILLIKRPTFFIKMFVYTFFEKIKY